MAETHRGTIAAVCVSAVRGVQKEPVAEIELLVDHGARGDAHAGTVEARQRLVSLYAAWGKPEKAREWRPKVEVQSVK